MNRHRVKNSVVPTERPTKTANIFWPNSPKTHIRNRFRRTLGFLCLGDRRMLSGILGTTESFAVLAASTVTNTVG